MKEINTDYIIPTPHGGEIHIPHCTYSSVLEKIISYLKHKIPGIYTNNQRDVVTNLTNLHFLLNQKEQKVSIRYAFHLIDNIVQFAENMTKSEDIRCEFLSCEFLTCRKNVYSKLLIRANYLAYIAITEGKEDDIDSLEKYFNFTMGKIWWYNKLLEAIDGLIEECYIISLHGWVGRMSLHPGYEGATVSDNKALKNRVNNLYNQEEENNMKITGVYSNTKKGRTTIKFADGRVVSVQCDKEDKFDVHKGIAMALAKAAFGSKVLQECLSSYSEQKSGEENKKAKKARKEKAKAKQENDIKEEK